MKIGLRFVVASMAATLLVPSIYSWMLSLPALCAKDGRVVDATTGEGLQDVTVIASAEMAAASLYGASGSGSLYRVIVHTDADGNYHIPNALRYSVLWFPPVPGTMPKYQWHIALLQYGYAVPGDEPSWTFDDLGRSKYWPPSVAESPHITWQGFSAKIATHQLVKVVLSIKESSTYYRYVLSGVRPHIDPSLEEEHRIREYLYAFFLPRVCALHADELLDTATVESLQSMSINPETYLKELNRLQKINWDLRVRTFVSAGKVCAAMKAGA